MYLHYIYIDKDSDHWSLCCLSITGRMEVGMSPFSGQVLADPSWSTFMEPSLPFSLSLDTQVGQPTHIGLGDPFLHTLILLFPFDSFYNLPSFIKLLLAVLTTSTHS